MSHKLGICIPYRNRKQHLDKLIPHLSQHLKKKGIDHKFYVGHQVDDKLFNRGAMKNIAAHYAFNDGCDYIAWHDVDMIVHENDADYSYPENNPLHIATKLSKYNYSMGYDQYFGGVVLFTKEQAYSTNGYSNDYWDWGQEDDDLFWRCYFEGMTTGDIFKNYVNKSYGEFNGKDSYISIETDREISSCLSNDHTISILFNAEQQQEKVPIWLVGDKEKKFIEYPLLRKDGSWTWGLSFNNSRAVTIAMFDKLNQYQYNYAKRFENLWTWVTVSYKQDDGDVYLYVNDELIRNTTGIKENLPFHIKNELKRHDGKRPFLVGFCNHTNTHFKGKIAEVKIYDRFTEQKDIKSSYEDGGKDTLVHYKFDQPIEGQNVEIKNGDIEVIDNILPFRKEGSFYCLPHIDEGFVNGTWAKGETTAANEKRFVTEMQQGKINYKDEGLNKITGVTQVVELDETLYPNTMFINTKMK